MAKYKMKKWKNIGIVLTVLICIAWCVIMVKRNGNRAVNDIIVKHKTIDENYFLNDSLVKYMVNQRLMKKSLKLTEISVDSLEQWLNKNSFVKQAEVYKEEKGNVVIEIQQKKPILRVKDARKIYYLTEDYDSVPLSKIYASNTLLVEGKIDRSEFQPLVDVTRFILEDDLLKKNIVGIKKGEDNTYYLKVNTGSYDIVLGDLNHVEEKFKKLKNFYDQYLIRVGVSYYKKIHLEYNNQVVAQRRDL